MNIKIKKIILVIFSFLLLLSCSSTDVKKNSINNNGQIDRSSCVGTSYFNIVDKSRPEILTEDKSDFRDIMVKIWYPAEKDDNAQPVDLWYLTESHSLPVDKVPSESYLNATPLKGSFPTILYSHGYIGQSSSNQLLIEHLVKKGYIVVSVVHNYQAGVMVEHDNSLNEFNENSRFNDFFLAEEATITGETLNKEIWKLFGKDLTEEQKDRVYTLMEWAEGDHLWIDYWIKDFESVLSTLTRINSGEDVKLYNSQFDYTKFQNAFDLEKILALGSSMGGIVSLDFSNQNPNCIGAVNMDAIHYSLQRDGSYNKPYLYLHAGGGPLPAAKLVLEQQLAPAYLIGVDGAKHINFTDGSIFMRHWFNNGDINGSRMIQIMNETIGTFFDSCLDSGNMLLFDEYIKNQSEFSILKNR